MNKFLESIRHDSTRKVRLDPSTSYFEFHSYLECCQSLNILPSVTRFVIYNELWNKQFKEQ